MDRAGVQRVLVIAQELDAVGRRDDAELLARLAAEVEPDAEPAVTDAELDRRLAQADEEIKAGRVTANEDVWAAVDAARVRRATAGSPPRVAS